MLFQMDNESQVDATPNVKTRMSVHAVDFTSSAVLKMMRAFNAAAIDQRGGWQPSLGLELALAEVLETNEDTAPAPVVQPSAKPKPKPVVSAAVKRTRVPEPVSAKKTEASPPSTRAADSHPKLSSQQLTAAWKDIRARVKKSDRNLEALLNSCKSLEVKGETLLIGMASEVLAEKIEKPASIETTQKAINDILGVTLQIKCVVTNAKNSVPSGIDKNGLVAAAVQAGGKVVEIQE
jgi:DNA polymerase III gamma/tau subunit